MFVYGNAALVVGGRNRRTSDLIMFHFVLSHELLYTAGTVLFSSRLLFQKETETETDSYVKLNKFYYV